jgi:transcriptional regulator of acetoin/glycerol metabolism
MLVDSFLQRGGNLKHRYSVQAEAMRGLQAHPWPGNIRELRNVLERARLYADDGVIRAEDLPEALGRNPLAVFGQAPAKTSADSAQSLAALRAEASEAELRRLVASQSGTRREMAVMLGMSERTLYRRLKALGLD